MCASSKYVNRLDEQNKHIFWNWSDNQSDDFNYVVRTSILKWKHTIQSTWWNHRFGVVILIPYLSYQVDGRNQEKKHEDFFHPTVVFPSEIQHTYPKWCHNWKEIHYVPRPVNFSTYMIHCKGISLVYMDYIPSIQHALRIFTNLRSTQYTISEKGWEWLKVFRHNHYISGSPKRIKQQPHQKTTSNNALFDYLNCVPFDDPRGKITIKEKNTFIEVVFQPRLKLLKSLPGYRAQFPANCDPLRSAKLLIQHQPLTHIL